MRDRIQNHPKRPTWQNYLGQGNELCYSFAAITTDRDRAEAALIFHQQPPVNDMYKDKFPFDDTTLQCGGKCALVDSSFTVRRKD